MRREERVTVQGPVKKQQPDGMSHGGGGLADLDPADILCPLTVVSSTCNVYAADVNDVTPPLSCTVHTIPTDVLRMARVRLLTSISLLLVTACAACCADLVSTNTHVTSHESPFRGLEPLPISGGGGGGVVAERGSKGHPLIPSIQMPEMLPRTVSKCCGLFSSCVAAVPVACSADRCAYCSGAGYLAGSLVRMAFPNLRWLG